MLALLTFSMKSFFVKKSFLFILYINILYYICKVLPMLMGSVTKNSSMKEHKEGHYIFSCL